MHHFPVHVPHGITYSFPQSLLNHFPRSVHRFPVHVPRGITYSPPQSLLNHFPWFVHHFPVHVHHVITFSCFTDASREGSMLLPAPATSGRHHEIWNYQTTTRMHAHVLQNLNVAKASAARQHDLRSHGSG
ncbi:hypothetical protein EON63_17075 [archaeon]|nr:MAG: hypothetical protein EON63_17075 [archaeon]